MKSLFAYLRTHKLVWMLPLGLLLLIAVLAVIAWQVSGSPESPFIYDDF